MESEARRYWERWHGGGIFPTRSPIFVRQSDEFHCPCQCWLTCPTVQQPRPVGRETTSICGITLRSLPRANSPLQPGVLSAFAGAVPCGSRFFVL
jgi:hypothetical protein